MISKFLKEKKQLWWRPNACLFFFLHLLFVIFVEIVITLSEPNGGVHIEESQEDLFILLKGG